MKKNRPPGNRWPVLSGNAISNISQPVKPQMGKFPNKEFSKPRTKANNWFNKSIVVERFSIR